MGASRFAVNLSKNVGIWFCWGSFCTSVTAVDLRGELLEVVEEVVDRDAWLD